MRSSTGEAASAMTANTHDGRSSVMPAAVERRPAEATFEASDRGDEAASEMSAPEGLSVSVAIGRIAVQVAAPPTPPAPRARPAPQRTRGFDGYAAARRGRPR